MNGNETSMKRNAILYAILATVFYAINTPVSKLLLGTVPATYMASFLYLGACGAGISAGMFVSIVTGSTPLAGEPWGLANKMTSAALDAIGSVGGPRCCKRDSYLSILAAIDFVKENLGVEMEKPEVVCVHSAQNNQCIGVRCPFSKVNH